MRRSWIALLVVAAATVIACAHPTEDPLPGEPTPAATSHRPSTPVTTSTGGDQTEQVCSEAVSRSNEVVDEIKDKISQAQANPASAAATLLSVRATATQWKQDLQDYADRPINRTVKDALNRGIDVIDDLLSKSPQELAADASEAQQKIQDFLSDLKTACR